jgi:hypothetical protein
MWLCTNYWESMEWSPPVDEKDKDIIGMCNFICAHSSHGTDFSYCNK